MAREVAARVVGRAEPADTVTAVRMAAADRAEAKEEASMVVVKVVGRTVEHKVVAAMAAVVACGAEKKAAQVVAWVAAKVVAMVACCKTES